MIDKLIAQSRVTEVNDVATRTSGAFQTSGLTDPYLGTTFTSLSAARFGKAKIPGCHSFAFGLCRTDCRQ